MINHIGEKSLPFFLMDRNELMPPQQQPAANKLPKIQRPSSQQVSGLLGLGVCVETA